MLNAAEFEMSRMNPLQPSGSSESMGPSAHSEEGTKDHDVDEDEDG